MICRRTLPRTPPLMDLRPLTTVAVTRFADLLALGIAALLEGDPTLDVVAHDIEHPRVPVVLRARRPQVLVLDASALRDAAEVRELAAAHPGTRLVLLGDAIPPGEAAQLLAFGASACLATTTQGRDLRHAIHLSARGLQLMPRGAWRLGGAAEPGAPRHDARLTRREGDVLVLLRQGRSNAQIALALHIGVETVRTHARSIYRKLGVASRADLFALTAPVFASAPEVEPEPRAPRRVLPRPAPRRPLRH